MKVVQFQEWRKAILPEGRQMYGRALQWPCKVRPCEANEVMAKLRPKFLGEKVKFYREERKLYKVELADIVGVSTGYIGSIEQGVRTSSLKLLKKIAKALKVSPKDFL